MNSDSFSSAVYNPTFTTRRNYFATQSGITSGSTSNGVFQINTDSGVNSPFFASVPSQTGVIGSKTPVDVNSNAAILAGDFGRPGQDYRGAAPFFSSSSFDGHPFSLQATGNFTVATASTSAAPTITIFQASQATMNTSLAAGLSGNAALVAAGHSIVAAPTSNAVTTVGTYAYYVNASLIWTSASALLSGEVWGVVTGPVGTQYTTRAVLTGISVTNYFDLNFFGALSFTGASSVVGCTPLEFSLSAL